MSVTAPDRRFPRCTTGSYTTGRDTILMDLEVKRAIRVGKEIEPYYSFWLEESMRPEYPDSMRKLADHVNIPLPSCECN